MAKTTTRYSTWQSLNLGSQPTYVEEAHGLHIIVIDTWTTFYPIIFCRRYYYCDIWDSLLILIGNLLQSLLDSLLPSTNSNPLDYEESGGHASSSSLPLYKEKKSNALALPLILLPIIFFIQRT